MKKPDPDHLFSPLQQRNITLANRIVCSPMCQYSAADGFATDWHFVHLGSRAVGGAGLIVTEDTSVSPEARITPGGLGIWKDEHIPGLLRITSFLKEQGAVPGVQLAHAGRKGSMALGWEKIRTIPPEEGGWQVLAPTAERFAPEFPLPIALDRTGMDKIVADYAAATKRAVKAGFLLAEVHSAHGYLSHQFLSPGSNKRTDEYGGSLANRARFPLEIVRGVRDNFPQQHPVWVRLSVTDWVEGGLTIDDSIEYCKMLKAEGIDLIDCSSGGNDPRQQIPVGPGYQVAFAERIRREVGIATGTVGMITEPAQADQIVRSGQADVVDLAREFLRNPYWPLHAADALNQSISWPQQYLRAAKGVVERRRPVDRSIIVAQREREDA